LEQVRLCTPVWKSLELAPRADFSVLIPRTHCLRGPSVAGDENVGGGSKRPSFISYLEYSLARVPQRVCRERSSAAVVRAEMRARLVTLDPRPVKLEEMT